MKQTLLLAMALGVGLLTPVRAQTPGGGASTGVAAAFPRLAENTPVVIVGEVTGEPHAIVKENRMQVAIGPAKMDYTLHLSDAKMYDQQGATIDSGHLSHKDWVRAEGFIMNDPRRIKVTKLQVIGKDLPSLRQSAFYRPGFDQGYLMAVAGTLQVYPETAGALFAPVTMTVVGHVSGDTGPLEAKRKIQVDAAGNTWTLSVPKDTPIFDVTGKKISVHEIAKGQWVRVHGWQTDDLRMRTARIQEIGPQEAFTTSAFFRTGQPMGYVERMPGTGVQFSPLHVAGVITAIDVAGGTVTLRDDKGMARVFPLDSVIIRADGRPVDINTLRQGQTVTIEGNEIVF